LGTRKKSTPKNIAREKGEKTRTLVEGGTLKSKRAFPTAFSGKRREASGKGDNTKTMGKSKRKK